MPQPQCHSFATQYPAPVGRRPPVTPDRICTAVALLTEETMGRETGRCLVRRTTISHECFRRQVAMYVSHVIFGLSQEKVGHAFARDRTTVSHACRRVEDRRDDRNFDEMLSGLERAASGLSPEV